MIPVIWEQHQAYLVRQSEFKVGNRANEPMPALIKRNSRARDRDAGGAFRAEALAQAKSAARFGGRDGARLGGYRHNGILGQGEGLNCIAGQNRAYLKTLHEFKSKTRSANPWMSDILTPLTPDDLAALAAFMAGC